jgi:small conductance mechanosensitive channel
MIMLYRPYDLGDVVTAAGVTGKVDSMNLVSTSIKTPDNQTIVVPNSSIWGDVITNVTANDQRRVDMVFGIGYDDDIGKAKALLGEIVSAHPLVLSEPQPMIRVHELADSSVNFIVRPWAKTGDYWDVYWDLQQTVKERFDAAGISIPYPQTDVHVHQVVGGA